MNNKISRTLYVTVALLGMWACSDSFLNQPAKGALSPTQVASPAGVEQTLIGTYSNLAGNPGASNGAWAASYTNWVYGSVVGAETFKGSNSGDQSLINPLASFSATSTNGYLSDQWSMVYDGINRSNTTLKLMAQLPAGSLAQADIDRITGEARFLRGLMHLEAVMMWGKIPYVDETIDYGLGNYRVSNAEDPMPKIIADFDDAIAKLAVSGMAAGRANKSAAKAYKAKALMFSGKLSDAYVVLKDVIATGVTPGGARYDLLPNYHDAFDVRTENSVESVFAIQSSVNDGSGANHANPDLVLNYPYLSSLPVGCCGFNQPTYDLANSYRTTPAGLPLLDGSYNTQPLADETWVTLGTAATADGATDKDPLDPRIDWVMGRTGVPFYDWGVYNGPAWVRLLSDGGPYTPKKYAFPKDNIGTYTDGSSWTPGYNATNQYLIRYADVLLWAAECAADAGELANATAYVNQIRRRAMTGKRVKLSKDPKKSDYQAYTDPSIASVDAGNYKISLYPTFADKATAIAAAHMERKLELGIEGHRFFDLVRWGETVATPGLVTLMSAINYNATLNNLAKEAANNGFQKGKNEHYPIPQNQIDLNIVDGTSVLAQNPGY